MPHTRLPIILVVDDSQTTRAMIKRIIGMIDLPVDRVLEASDGQEGLRRLESSNVDLILADLNMPGMDGFEMIERIGQDTRWKSIPILVISAQPDPHQVENLKRNGVAGYLQKPFTPEAMRSLVLPLLEKAPGGADGEEEEGSAFNLSLAEALASALETMAFITPALWEGPSIPSLPAGSRLVRVEFNGTDTRGSLALAASPEFLAAMVANLDESNELPADDALKELANVTCGMLLRMRPGGGVGFHLHPPQVSAPPDFTPAALFKSDDVVAFEVDGQLIEAHVATDAAFYGA